MIKYQAIILTSRGSEQDLQDKINNTLNEFSSQGGKLHSQNCGYGEFGQHKSLFLKRDIKNRTGEGFKCTLIFEKESK